MISVDNLTVSFGGWDLFKDISFLINPKDRIGLVGKNGAGKSTMLKVLTGEQPPSSGGVSRNGDCTIGYLPQQMKVADTTTLYAETEAAFGEVIDLEKEIAHLTEQITVRTDYESKEYETLLHRLNDCNDRFQILGGLNREAEIEKTLLGLGFKRSDFTRATSEFSGGWRMRIELAKLLLRRPSLFLLDEPTNHLDIESIEWLESYLKEYNGAVVLISHDRAFLDNVTTRTIEISLGKATDYKVPYSRYVELRNERRQQQMAAYLNQQKMIEQTEDFIERFRYKPTKSNQVQSRIKQLEEDRAHRDRRGRPRHAEHQISARSTLGTGGRRGERGRQEFRGKARLFGCDLNHRKGRKSGARRPQRGRQDDLRPARDRRERTLARSGTRRTQRTYRLLCAEPGRPDERRLHSFRHAGPRRGRRRTDKIARHSRGIPVPRRRHRQEGEGAFGRRAGPASDGTADARALQPAGTRRADQPHGHALEGHPQKRPAEIQRHGDRRFARPRVPRRTGR